MGSRANWKASIMWVLTLLMAGQTYAQVELVADLNPGPDRSRPTDLIVFNERLHFWADDGLIDPSLYATDGSTPFLVADMFPGLTGTPHSLQRTLMAIHADRLYFRFQRLPPDTGRYNLWSTDGNEAHLVADVTIQDLHSASLGDKLLFTAGTDSTGLELWSIEGDSVRLVQDILEGPDSGFPSCFTTLGELVFFTARDSSNVKTVWTTDGYTVNKVSESPTWCQRERHSIIYNGEWYFSGDTEEFGREPWKTDGTTSSMIADVNPGAANSVSRNWIVALDKLFFVADDGVHGYEFWSWDGAEAKLEFDLNPGSEGGLEHVASSHPTNAIVFEHKLYFVGDSGTSGRVLWSWDGQNLEQITESSLLHPRDHPYPLIIFGSELVFTNYTDDTGGELWSLKNGVASIIRDINPGPQSSSPSYFVEYNSFLYFKADHTDYGEELWRYRPIPTNVEHEGVV